MSTQSRTEWPAARSAVSRRQRWAAAVRLAWQIDKIAIQLLRSFSPAGHTAIAMTRLTALGLACALMTLVAVSCGRWLLHLQLTAGPHSYDGQQFG